MTLHFIFDSPECGKSPLHVKHEQINKVTSDQGFKVTSVSVRGVISSGVLMFACVVSFSGMGCLIDFNEAIPCTSDNECPTGFVCDFEMEQCQEDNSSATVTTGETTGGTTGGGTTGGSTAGGTTGGTIGGTIGGTTGGGSTGTSTGGTTIDDPGGPCPPGMHQVTDFQSASFCIDNYEASRIDATEAFEGANNSVATSRIGVLPWTSLSYGDASAACIEANKRLCSVDEWSVGCGGPEMQRYPYSNSMFVQGLCNASGTLNSTGFNSGCVYENYMTFDMSGNVSEIIASTDGSLLAKGGAYTARSGSEISCSQAPIRATASNFVGFRCCSDVRN